MAVTSLANVLPGRPATVEQEFFPAPDFEAQALTIEPLDARRPPVLGLGYVVTVAVQTAYLERGLIGPFELVKASPSGRHTREQLDALPLALTVFTDEPGTWQLTLRETAHMRWWGSTSFNVAGGRS